MANYLEHYGLLRANLPYGLYEHCQPKHPWNNNHLFSNAITSQLRRQSDHHANASRHDQILRDYQDVPELPASYPMMQVINTIPPLRR